MADVQVRLGGGRSAEEGLQVEAGAAIAGAVVVDEEGLLGLELGDGVELGEEDRLLVADQLGQPDDADGCAALGGSLGAADHPLLVSDDDTSAWREGLRGSLGGGAGRGARAGWGHRGSRFTGG